ncbi:MAG: protease [Bdellovibrio sp.]|nr:MAG: protease [Bdellovibrio sp.]
MTRIVFLWVAAFFTYQAAFATTYIIKTKNSPLNMNFQLKSLESQNKLQIMDSHPSAHLLKVEIPEESELTTLSKLSQLPEVEYIVKDFKLKAFRAPLTASSISKLREQWAIAKVHAEKAWKLAKNKGNKKIIVAVIDTGVDYNHESLKGNVIKGYDFRDNDNDPMDEVGRINPGHGTHVAGIIGATGLVNNGVIGISPTVSIMPVRFLGKDGSGDLVSGIKAIDYAIKNGAKIISASWGATVSRAQAKPLIEAVKRANDAGVIFISAASNDGRNNDQTDVFPANAKFENTISVAASSPDDTKPSWSNYGRHMVDLASPGLNIISTIPGNKYRELSGTSMATPLVSGLVALLAAQKPNITGAEVRSLLQTTGAKVNIETACNCRIDAGAAMEALVHNKMILVPAAATISPDETLQFKAMNAKGDLQFTVSNPEIATIDNNGLLTPKKEGEVTVFATDSEGHKASSLSVFIQKSSGGGGGGENPLPGQPGQCPIQNPQLCDILCQVSPNLPWCKN